MGKRSNRGGAELPLAMKFRSSPVRDATAIDFQTNDERVAVGQKLKAEREGLDLKASDETLIFALWTRPAFDWAVKAYTGKDQYSPRAYAQAVRDIARMIDMTASASACAAKINMVYEQNYQAYKVVAGNEVSTAPMFDATTLIALAPDNLTGTSEAIRNDAVVVRVYDAPQLPTERRMFVEWDLGRRATPGNPSGYLVYLETIRGDEMHQHPFISQALSTLGAPEQVGAVVQANYLADFGQSRLVGPLGVSLGIFDRENTFMNWTSRLVPIAEELFTVNDEEHPMAKSGTIFNSVLKVLTYADWDRVPSNLPNDKPHELQLINTLDLEL